MNDYNSSVHSRFGSATILASEPVNPIGTGEQLPSPLSIWRSCESVWQSVKFVR